MTAREELVRAVGEAILAEARKWPHVPGDRYGARLAPMGATGDDLARAALAVVDEELAVVRAKLALSPTQVEAVEQEIAELKQEHGVLSGQLHEIRTVLVEFGQLDKSNQTTALEALEKIDAILDGLVLASAAPRVFFPGDTVPAEVAVLSTNGAVVRWPSDWKVALGPCVEVTLPSPEEFQAAVERARDARADAEWQHTEGTNP